MTDRTRHGEPIRQRSGVTDRGHETAGHDRCDGFTQHRDQTAPMTDDGSSLIAAHHAGEYAKREEHPSVTTVSNPFWAARLANAASDDELMKTAYSYLLATLAHGWPASAARRNERRRDVAALLIEAAERP